MKSMNHKSTMARRAFHDDVLDVGLGTLDSMLREEDNRGLLPAVLPDTDIMYSYDTSNGQVAGNDILSYALNKAVERYENKVIEKIAKEYDFVDGKDDHVDEYMTDADEDGFELIDYANLL